MRKTLFVLTLLLVFVAGVEVATRSRSASKNKLLLAVATGSDGSSTASGSGSTSTSTASGSGSTSTSTASGSGSTSTSTASGSGDASGSGTASGSGDASGSGTASGSGDASGSGTASGSGAEGGSGGDAGGSGGAGSGDAGSGGSGDAGSGGEGEGSGGAGAAATDDSATTEEKPSVDEQYDDLVRKIRGLDKTHFGTGELAKKKVVYQSDAEKAKAVAMKALDEAKKQAKHMVAFATEHVKTLSAAKKKKEEAAVQSAVKAEAKAEEQVLDTDGDGKVSPAEKQAAAVKKAEAEKKGESLEGPIAAATGKPAPKRRKPEEYMMVPETVPTGSTHGRFSFVKSTGGVSAVASTPLDPFAKDPDEDQETLNESLYNSIPVSPGLSTDANDFASADQIVTVASKAHTLVSRRMKKLCSEPTCAINNPKPEDLV